MLNLGMDKSFFKITASAGILSVLLNLIIIRRFGYIGSTINWLITELFIFMCMYVVLRRQSLNPFNAEYFKPSAMMVYLEPLKQKFFPASKN
jgi:O-antigen/teichoic acid export membrane protein